MNELALGTNLGVERYAPTVVKEHDDNPLPSVPIWNSVPCPYLSPVQMLQAHRPSVLIQFLSRDPQKLHQLVFRHLCQPFELRQPMTSLFVIPLHILIFPPKLMYYEALRFSQLKALAGHYIP